MKISYSCFIIYFFSLSFLYPLEIGLKQGINTIAPNRFFSLLKKPIFYFYQIYEVHNYSSDNKRDSFQYEIFINFEDIYLKYDFLKIAVGNYDLSTLETLYIGPENSFKLKWKPNFYYFLVGYGIAYKIPHLSTFYAQIGGGIGFIPYIHFNFKATEININYFSIPREEIKIHKGEFTSYEGFLYRINFDLQKKWAHWIAALGFSYNYIISGNFRGQIHNNITNWYTINQNYLWITNDIQQYFLMKSEYEKQIQKLNLVFPKLDSVNPIFYLIDFYISISYRI